MAILLKASYMFNAILIKIPMTFITDIEKSTLKFIWKHERSRIAKAILSKKNNTGGITIPYFKLYYKAIAINIALYWHKNRQEDQWSRAEDPYMNPHNYAHLIFDKGATNILWKIDSLFKLKRGPSLSPCTIINSKWIKDLHIRPKTLKLVQERAENTLEAIVIGKDFLSRTPEAQELRERMDKWDYMKLKNFCTRKDIVSN
jgi:hypothetical protein